MKWHDTAKDTFVTTNDYGILIFNLVFIHWIFRKIMLTPQTEQKMCFIAWNMCHISTNYILFFSYLLCCSLLSSSMLTMTYINTDGMSHT